MDFHDDSVSIFPLINLVDTSALKMFHLINGLFLDLDGTIIDSRQAFFLTIRDWWRANFQGLRSPTYQQVMNTVHGTDLNGVLNALLPNDLKDSVFIKTAITEINNSFSTLYLPKYARLIDGAVDCLLKHREHDIKTAIVTNGTREMLDRSIQLFGLGNLLDLAISASEVKPKPDPSGILKALTLLNLKPEQAVYVGNTITDILAGRKAGVFTIGVLSGIGSEEELKNAGAHLLLKNIAHLDLLNLEHVYGGV